jgi:hypothetical protein
MIVARISLDGWRIRKDFRRHIWDHRIGAIPFHGKIIETPAASTLLAR